MDEYKGNVIRNKSGGVNGRPKETRDAKDLDRKVEKVVTGTVVTKKPSVMKEALSAFFVNDMKELKHFLIFDVLIPKSKDILSDLIDETKNMVLFGDTRRRSNGPNGRSSYGNGTYVSYGSFSRQSSSNRSETRYNLAYDEVVFSEKGDAEDVLSNLCELIDRYGQASIGDLYDLTGHSTTYTDYDYGWKNLTTASTKRVRDGYIIDLPKSQPLN